MPPSVSTNQFVGTAEGMTRPRNEFLEAAVLLVLTNTIFSSEN